MRLHVWIALGAVCWQLASSADARAQTAEPTTASAPAEATPRWNATSKAIAVGTFGGLAVLSLGGATYLGFKGASLADEAEQDKAACEQGLRGCSKYEASFREARSAQKAFFDLATIASGASVATLLAFARPPKGRQSDAKRVTLEGMYGSAVVFSLATGYFGVRSLTKANRVASTSESCAANEESACDRMASFYSEQEDLAIASSISLLGGLVLTLGSTVVDHVLWPNSKVVQSAYFLPMISSNEAGGSLVVGF